jgi:RNA polymerase sigma-70 factor (sigma-E family)
LPGFEDERDFAEFTRSRWGPLVRYAYGFTLDIGRAEDLVQEALLRCWRVRNRAGIEQPDAYVRRAVANLAISSGRRRWWQETVLGRFPDVAGPSESEPGHGAAQRDELRRALARLPPKQRVIVVLRHVEDLSERQVAELLGCSVGTVKSQTSRGLAALRRLIPPTESENLPFARLAAGGSLS